MGFHESLPHVGRALNYVLGIIAISRGSDLCAVKMKTRVSYVSSIRCSGSSCVNIIRYAMTIKSGKCEKMYIADGQFEKTGINAGILRSKAFLVVKVKSSS